MNIYKINNLFLIGGQTKDGFPYLAAGKQSLPDPQYFIVLRSLLDKFSVPPHCSPQSLDRLLAAELSKARPWPDLIGCTIKVPGIPGPTGGVLGKPSHKAIPAANNLEILGDGWKILSFQGSPGLAYKEAAGRTFYPEIKREGIPGKELLLQLAVQAYSSGVEELIAITDGTGKSARGSALIQYGRDYIAWDLQSLSYPSVIKSLLC